MVFKIFIASNPKRRNGIMNKFRTITLVRTALITMSLMLITLSCSPVNKEFLPEPKTFEIGETDFLLDGKPLVIKCGELHYSRIPREYWQHRLQMCKAMGLNTVCAYMFWNYHEPQQGEFNFSGMADVAAFCSIAQKEGLHVILRPGPYSCAEWDFGGFPYWLLKDDGMKVRSQYPAYLEACKQYILRVGKELTPLQVTNGGPIIMVQVENEYGSFGDDKEYIGILRDYWAEAGFEVPFFTCDGPVQLKNDVRDDIFCVVNFGSNPEKSFQYLREIRADGPLMCGEYYPGWFDHWGKKHHTGPTDKILKDLSYMLDNNASFSIYMVHGGTSFGFTVGANYSDRYQPQTTSYDYDAPISEAGWETPKFMALREMFSKYLEPGETLSDIPAKNPVISIPGISLDETACLFDQLGDPVESLHPEPMEMLGQGQGLVLYRAVLEAGPACTLRFHKLNDYALIFVDGKKVAVADRRAKPGAFITGFNDRGMNILKGKNAEFQGWEIPLFARQEAVRLDVLVEAMGHINYGAVMGDRKGIIGGVTLNEGGVGKEITDWKIFPFPLNDEQLSTLKFTDAGAEAPAFSRASFHLDETGDTFLDMSQWGKGVVWVNRHNLGRYWNIGPSQTLYLPGPWLKKGGNEILVLELVGAEQKIVRGLELPILSSLF